jgi:hypothetical protein
MPSIVEHVAFAHASQVVSTTLPWTSPMANKAHKRKVMQERLSKRVLVMLLVFSGDCGAEEGFGWVLFGGWLLTEYQRVWLASQHNGPLFMSRAI